MASLPAPSATSPRGRRLVMAASTAVLFLLFGALVLRPPALVEAMDERVTDLFFAAGLGDGALARATVVLAIDRKTLVESGGDWPRFFPRFATIVEKLTKAGARAIAFDLGISTAEEATARPFLAAVEAGPPFVLASTLPPERTDEAPPPRLEGERMLLASPALHRAYVDLVTPRSETARLRRLALRLERKGRRRDAFALVTAARAAGIPLDGVRLDDEELRFGSRSFPLEDGFFRVPYLARRGGVPQVSCADLLADRLPDAVFRDRVVIVGPADPRFHDDHLTPIGRILGAQIHANAVEALLEGRSLRRPSAPLRLLLVLLPALLAFAASARASRPVAWAVFALAAAGLAAGALFAPGRGIWFGPFLPGLALLLFALLPPVLRTVLGAMEGLRVKRLFGQFVSKEVFATLMAARDALDLEGTEVEATLLFADVRGFTTLSAALGPRETFRVLNEYLSEMVDVILAHGGRLDKFMGDGIMAVWGAPFASDDDPWNACRAAVTMLERLKLLNRHLSLEGRQELRIGVGLCTGAVHAGVIGTADKMEYAVIGDTVNTASRLEGMTKELGFPVVMAESTYRAVAHRVRAKDLGPRAVRGRREEVRVFALLETLGEDGEPLTSPRETPEAPPPGD